MTLTLNLKVKLKINGVANHIFAFNDAGELVRNGNTFDDLLTRQDLIDLKRDLLSGL